MRVHISKSQPSIVLRRQGRRPLQSDPILAVCPDEIDAARIAAALNPHGEQPRTDPIDFSEIEPGALDEVFARGAFHLERMDQYCWWLRLDHEDGDAVVLRFGPGYLRVEQDALEGYFYREDPPLRTLLYYWASVRWDWPERWHFRLPERLQEWIAGRPWADTQ